MYRFQSTATGVLAVVCATTLLAACGQGGSSSDNGSGKPGAKTTLTWWHNGTADPLKTVWTQTAANYHKLHPNVTIKVVPIQNEQFTTKVPLALQGSNPPDVYFNQGGGLLATQAQSGRVADISKATSSFVGSLGPVAEGWQSNGKQLGIPYDTHVVGFWYRKDLFARAGIGSPPTTMDDLNADVAKLKAKQISPIAIGGKDRWPDAFYYDYFAVRECSVDTLKASVKQKKFSDGCFTKAGKDVLDFLKTKPFQDGFNGTPAQQGAGSSAGLVANGKAAMELQGDWDPGVMQSLATDKSFADKLGWFPFPTVAGGQGDPKAALGGGDGFSCTTAKVAACVDFLKYLTSTPVQTKLVKAGAASIPVNPSARSAIANPTVKQVFTYSQNASYVQTYFDIALPTAAGQALDDAAADLFAGKGAPDSVAKAVNAGG